MTIDTEELQSILDRCFDGSQRPTHNFDDQEIEYYFPGQPVTHPVVNPLAGLYLVFGEDPESELGFGHLFGVAMTADGAKRLAAIEASDQFENWLFDSEQQEFQPQVKVEYRTVNATEWRDTAEQLAQCAECLFCDETGRIVLRDDEVEFHEDEVAWG